MGGRRGLFPHPAPSRNRGQAPGPPPGLRPGPQPSAPPPGAGSGALPRAPAARGLQPGPRSQAYAPDTGSGLYLGPSPNSAPQTPVQELCLGSLALGGYSLDPDLRLTPGHRFRGSASDSAARGLGGPGLAVPPRDPVRRSDPRPDAEAPPLSGAHPGAPSMGTPLPSPPWGAALGPRFRFSARGSGTGLYPGTPGPGAPPGLWGSEARFRWLRHWSAVPVACPAHAVRIEVRCRGCRLRTGRWRACPPVPAPGGACQRWLAAEQMHTDRVIRVGPSNPRSRVRRADGGAALPDSLRPTSRFGGCRVPGR